MVYIGIDVGGTGVQVGVVNEQGEIIAKDSFPTGVGRPYQEMIRDMADCTRSAVAKAGLTIDDVKAVGVGIPGIGDNKTGHVIFCTNLGWHDVPLRAEYQQYIDKPVYIDNDATVAGLAESVAGVSANTDSSVFLTLGTGVGGGIVIHGKVWSGFHGVGSEIGHMILKVGGEPCTCGNHGCVERYCSATAIIRMAKEAVAQHPESAILTAVNGDANAINAKVVFDAAKAGDEVALVVFREYVSYLSQAISSIMQFLDPEVVVLGGGVSKAGAFLLDAVRAEVPKYLLFKTMPHARIELAKLGPDAGIIGAAMLGK